MSANHAVADQASESFPNYEAKIQDSYIDGYDPVSLSAPHSSLEQTSTYIGMGFVLASLAGLGALVYGVSLLLWGSGTADTSPTVILIIGAVLTIGFLGAGFGLISSGRKNYKAYRKETGRRN